MGIICFCQNGHRTKLKDRFAGLRVRCPQCGRNLSCPHEDQARQTSATKSTLPTGCWQSLIRHLVAKLPLGICMLHWIDLGSRVRSLSHQYSWKTQPVMAYSPPGGDRVTQWKARNCSYIFLKDQGKCVRLADRLVSKD